MLTGLRLLTTVEVVAEGTVNELKQSVGASSLHVNLHDAGELEPARKLIDRMLGVQSAVSPEGRKIIAPLPDADLVADILIALREADIRLEEFSVQKPTLDEVFLTITGNDAQKDQANDTDQLEQKRRAQA